MRSLFIFSLLFIFISANEPNGFSRIKHALEDPDNELKNTNFNLLSGQCKPIYITKYIDGTQDNVCFSGCRNKQVYVHVSSEDWFSVSFSGTSDPNNNDVHGTTLTAPKTKNFEHMAFWPDLMICNINDPIIDPVTKEPDKGIDVFLEYANDSSFVKYSYTILLIALLFSLL